MLIGFATLFNYSHLSAQDILYGIQDNGTNYEMVTYDIVTGAETSLATIPASFGLTGVLTYNPDQQVFYCYSEFGATDITHLLEIDACSYAITDLGQVMVDGNPAYVSEGLAYDPVSSELYGTLSDMVPGTPMVAANYHSNMLVRYTLGTANCTQIGTNISQVTPNREDELDAITFTATYNPTSSLFGMDGNPFGAGFTSFYDVDYTVSIGNATGYFDNGSNLALRGFTYLESTDLVYSSLNNNSIVTIDPSYAFGPSVNHLNPVVTLVSNPSRNITGLVWGPELCCAASSDSLFTTISSDVLDDTYWDGKIYIPDNTIITVNDAVLDITTADVVFGQCSGINFVNGAVLRANNTVFRPCALDGTWRGLSFDNTGEIEHQVNECTFKNAEVALDINNHDKLFINSNTFSNCNEGVRITNAALAQSIVGNNFMTNDAYPSFSNCYSNTAPSAVIHIHADNRNEGEPVLTPLFVTQNRMVMTNTSGTLHVTGVHVMNNTASISENTFTNMTDGVVIQMPSSKVNIESNDFEINAVYETSATSTSQISIFNSSNFVFVNNNNLANSGVGAGFTRTGLFTENVRNFSAKNNSINGFTWGIFVNNSTGVNLSENHVSNADRGGIFFDELHGPSENYITCNDITMDVNQGVGIWTRMASSSTEVTSNCVKDGNVGIRTEGTGTIPRLRNNFVYNYARGIDNIGHSGNIGANGDPGLNTLWSNNSGALDISSAGASITVSSNYGLINATWATVSYLGTNAADNVHSNASCALQIVDYDNQQNLNTTQHCDRFDEFIFPAANGNNPSSLTLPSQGELVTYIATHDNDFMTLSKIMGTGEVMSLQSVNALLVVSDIEDSQKAMLLYSYYKANGNIMLATETLETLLALNADYATFVAAEAVVLEAWSNGALSELDYINLLNSEVSDEYYNIGVSLSKRTDDHGVYRYTYPSVKNISAEAKSSYYGESGSTISTFPNPFSDVLTVQVLSENLMEKQDLVVYNLSGKEIYRENLTFVSGQVTVNLSHLAQGTYLVTLSSEAGVSAQQKIVKL